jgi:voltage-gated potassium channel
VEITSDDRKRLDRYEERSALPMLALAILFVFVYGFPIIWPDLPFWLRSIFDVLNIVLWSCFVADLGARAVLSGRPGGYLLRHPIDVLLVALPMLRPLRVLRVFLAAEYVVTRGHRFALGRTLLATLTSVAFLGFIGALAMLDAERGAPGSTINTYPRALWWVAETLTTVGYGDTYPVTTTGRWVAVALMLVGISLVGVVTASVAAWFVSQTRQEQDTVTAEIRALREEVQKLRQAGESDGPPSSLGH